ncbi:MAG: PilZ domain-containing protein [Thermodesulfobacteriota bacterium]
MTGERRRQPRFPIRLPVRVDGEEPAAGSREGTSRDLSPAGLFLATDHALAPGSPVQVEIRLPAEQVGRYTSGTGVRLRVSGTVVRQEAGGIAIRFEGDCQLLPQEP